VYPVASALRRWNRENPLRREMGFVLVLADELIARAGR
jgi:hypothetical protein